MTVMRAGIAVVLVVAGCDRLFALEHIDTVSCQDHDFCDDFNREAGVDVRWDKRIELGGSTLQLSDSSLLVSLPTPADKAYLEKILPLVSSTLVVQAAVALDQVDTTAEIDLLALEWEIDPAPCTHAALMLVTRQQPRVLALQETYIDCGGLVYSTIIGHDAGFRTVTMTVSLGPPSTVQVLIDGQLALDRMLQVDLPPAVVRLRVGASYVGSESAPWQLRFDDVAADSE